MKRKKILLTKRYATALRSHLKQVVRASLQAAVKLGHEAVSLGLETLELAQIHEKALATIKLSIRQNGLSKRAQAFFSEANSPIEATHRTTQLGRINLKQLNSTLGRRTEELATSRNAQKIDLALRRVMKDALTKSGKDHDKTLAESLLLQNHLRQLTHQALAAEEDGRKKMSCDLRNEIAQTLLAINTRLLNLKKVARDDTASLKNEIASAQRMVLKSVRSVRRFARELDTHPHTSAGFSAKNI